MTKKCLIRMTFFFNGQMIYFPEPENKFNQGPYTMFLEKQPGQCGTVFGAVVWPGPSGLECKVWR